jgi:serine/threonine-protein kinase
MTHHDLTAIETRHDPLRDALQAALAPAIRLEHEISGGGMSRLFVATQRFPARRVVVKALPRGADHEAVRRFRREIAVTTALHHPRVLPVLGAGQTERLLYYVMPLVEGGSLADRLRDEGRLSVAESVRMLRELGEALAHAHAHGVVHGDVKPDNVLLSEGHAVLADFGGARLAPERRTLRGEAEQAVVGTPLYMSPEQAAGDPMLDARSDVYSLAVVGYELLTGRPPFRGASPRAVLLAHLGQPVPPLRTLRPDVPPALAAVLERALAKDPARRFASASAFLAALGGAGGRTPVSARACTPMRPAWRAAAAVIQAPALATLGGILASGGGLALLLSATTGTATPSRVERLAGATADAPPTWRAPVARPAATRDVQRLAVIVVRPPWSAAPIAAAPMPMPVRATATCGTTSASRQRIGTKSSA